MDLDNEELRATRKMNGTNKNRRVRFSKEIKVSKDIQEAINGVSEVYQMQGRKLEFKDRIALSVYNAILDVETENKEEEIMKAEYLVNINKIIYNYEELRPTLAKYFEEKRNREKWEK